ncbi:YciE/YciF ferroxidase family protein [Halopiger djelfimassiliensis]|uniref:YciE/YciF ferroxidase family protein n=1 Tax=Halopiger djelfimassiliensis TaxID=1293047 RepID=UPI0006780BAD|nr:DUF892 family protein [Halopiger djelfimassiliensis]
MNIETLEDLFGYQLQHAYYAERTHVELLAELSNDASSDELASRFTDHREETDRHVDRLERVFEALGRQPRASRSRTVDGLAEARRLGHESAIGDDGNASSIPGPLEIGLLAERLEIRSYETLLTLAGRLAYADDVVEPLEANLADERETLQALEDLETELSIVESLEPDEA